MSMKKGVIMPEIDPQLIEMLRQARDEGASDLHISVATPPVMRLHNTLIPLPGAPRLMPPDTQRLLFSVMGEDHRRTLMENGEVDMAFGLPEIGRFRINIYRRIYRYILYCYILAQVKRQSVAMSVT